MGGPLSGLTIVELAGIGPGPMCSMMLGDMGADVIRIDRTRTVVMDRFADPKYAVHNRSRRSVSVDLQKKEGVEVVLRLIDKADGLTEPFHDPGPKSFDQRIGTREQVKHLRDRGLVLQVQLDDLAATAGDRLQALLGANAIKRDDLRAHVGEHHAGEGARADAGELDHAEAGEGACGAELRLRSSLVEHVLMSWNVAGQIVSPRGGGGKRL